ncbi:hypothetical protein FBU59_001161 [Linderina macrospora]|uniref:Uncharacterized protein n=1 Tax=Linderina macrospora TaxID=4868 RepID=A0ACC1JEM1_9FUNG|nr:hypothetical protein FBU59_001161 [Linderina macrospora]
MGIIFGTMHLVKRFGLENPEYALYIRSMYAIGTIALLGMTFMVKQKITQKNDTTALEYDNTATGSSGERVVTTIVKYDLQEVAKLQKSTMFTLAIVLFMHFKFGYIQPLILQSILPLFNFVKSPLFQVHVMGRQAVDSLARPWVPESPFGGAPAPTSASTESAAPAETADKKKPAASETRKDK